MQPVEMLERFVSAPSGSHDTEDVNRCAEIIAKEFEALGMTVTRRPGTQYGTILECVYGHGPRKLLLMGHMDTVFPRGEYIPFRVENGRAYGSGAFDMKGGLVTMNFALANVLPNVNPDEFTITALLNPDEEVGSPSSHEHILRCAQGVEAVLSYEPSRPTDADGHGGCLVCERKGVTSFVLRCTGVRGHAGMAYLSCHSAIQELCARITELYKLRDDAREISINIGKIAGGTVDNVVADYAEAFGEFRYFEMKYRPEIMKAIEEICARPGVSGTTTQLEFLAAHPAASRNEKSLALFERARRIAADMGETLTLERTGGAGDISIAAQTGAPVLDGLGITGNGAHTRSEYTCIDRYPFFIELSTRLLTELTQSK